MNDDTIVFYIFLIFTGAAVLATVALYARQALLVVYIVLGILFGPSVLGLVNDPKLMQDLSHVGIIFLLFLLGLNLPPQKLVPMFRETIWVAGLSTLIFFAIGFGMAYVFNMTLVESILIGVAFTFSSTIIALKLLPTTALHHQHIGEIIISILLFQDIIAIIVLMAIKADWVQQSVSYEIFKLVASLVGLIGVAYLFERFILIRLIQRFDQIQEYIFLMAIGWCLGMAEAATLLGLSAEIGAFIAGVVLATNPIALYIGDTLRPLRDFFLIIFFFALGASFELGLMTELLPLSLLFAVTALILKPVVFDVLLAKYGEARKISRETGARLGQISEFSLLIAVLSMEVGLIGMKANYLIQLSTIITFILSSYYIVLRYPSPMAVSEKLRRD